MWYRDSSEPEIDEIPFGVEMRNLTVEELISSTKGHTITHMCIKGDIPPLDMIAPHIKQLKIRELSHNDQIMWWVPREYSLCF